MEQEPFPGGYRITTNQSLIAYLRNYGMIQSVQVEQTMETIDRALFVRRGSFPYIDTHHQIGQNSYISAPTRHAAFLELLRDHLRPGMNALDIGSGSGYITACFAIMVGPTGRAVGVERDPEVVDFSIENIRSSTAAELLENGSLSVNFGDGRNGWEHCAPYDAIHFGDVADKIYPQLVRQLRPGGRLVITVWAPRPPSARVIVIDKNVDGTLTRTFPRFDPIH
ncbi:hypothetical protein ABFS83_09G010200 [Erythranthe nasuta]